MNFLHSCSPKVLHRDLKSQNILLDSDMHAKVADFGLSKLTSDDISTMTTNLGTVQWTAPEILQGEVHYSTAVDIYSYGIVMWEVSTGRIPYSDKKTPVQIAMQVCSGERPPITPECSIFQELIVN